MQSSELKSKLSELLNILAVLSAIRGERSYTMLLIPKRYELINQDDGSHYAIGFEDPVEALRTRDFINSLGKKWYEVYDFFKRDYIESIHSI